ncbi:MAG: DUF4249 family protein [Calditrichaeota bacterium]|nr:MAG: DUF4249 family protein [Calditrichota bacterium]
MRYPSKSLWQLFTRRLKDALVFFPTLLFLFSCSTDPVVVDDRLQGQIYVLGLLSNAAPHQTIRLESVAVIGQPAPVENANVSVSDSFTTYNFKHIGHGLYQDLPTQIPIRPGATYHLRVQVPGHEPIFAETRMPHRFSILSPAKDDTVVLRKQAEPNYTYYFNTVEVAWQRRDGWLSRVREVVFNTAGKEDFYYDCYSAEETLPLQQNFWPDPHQPGQGLPTKARFFISQLDSAFSIYNLVSSSGCVRLPDDPVQQDRFDKLLLDLRQRYQPDQINVRGAAGIFGAVLIDSVEVAFKIGETP